MGRSSRSRRGRSKVTISGARLRGVRRREVAETGGCSTSGRPPKPRQEEIHPVTGEAALRAYRGKTRLAVGASVVALLASAGAAVAAPAPGKTGGPPEKGLVHGPPAGLDPVPHSVPAAGGVSKPT